MFNIAKSCNYTKNIIVKISIDDLCKYDIQIKIASFIENLMSRQDSILQSRCLNL